MKKTLENILYPLFVVLIVFLIWQIAAWIIDVDLILPRPLAAIQNIGALFKNASFWTSLGWTYLRSLESFGLAFLIALLCSIFAYINRSCEKIFNPLMAIVRAIPTMSIILILVISLTPRIAPVIVSFIVISPTLYQSFLAGFKGIDQNLVEMVELYKVPKKKQIIKFYIPSVLPTILDNSAAGISLTIKLVIAAEALAQTRNSIGRMMQGAKVALEVEQLFALTILAVILSLFSEWLIRFIAKKVCRHA